MSPDRSPRQRRTDALAIRMFMLTAGLVILIATGAIVVGVVVLLTLNADHGHSGTTFANLLHNQLVMCRANPRCRVAQLQGVTP